MTAAPPRRRLVRRLLVGQFLVILIGAATLGVVAFLVAPPIFNDHVRRAVGPVSDVVAHHLDAALSETLLLALTIGVVVSAVAAAGLSWLVASRVARPVERLSAAAHELASGRLEARAAPPLTDDELADLTEAFNRMAATLEATEGTRRQLLGDLAHELRTPLATLEAYHEGLVDGVVEAEHDTWETLKEATGRLQRLVEDIALVSRAEEGQLSLERETLDLRDVVRREVEAFAPTATDRGIALEAQLPSQPLPVSGDRDRLGQVLANLLDNALAHTPVGGRVTVHGTRTDRTIRVTIADTGAGIATEHLPHLFDRFFRADPARGRSGGSGIGLTISRAIVRGHGGDIDAHSAGPGTGSSFTIELPIRSSQGAR